MISREEYARRAQAEGVDWAPGWEAVEAPFAALYPDVEPRHMATTLVKRAVWGGDLYLDGASLYPSPRGYQHIVSFGMSSPYADLDSYGGEDSGWGYELTAKIGVAASDDALWMLGIMGDIARYTYTTKRFFQPYETMAGRSPILDGSDTALTSFLVVPDTEVTGVDSVHGRLDFLQLVGITDPELAWVTEAPTTALARGRELAARLAVANNEALAIDLGRTSLI